MLPFGSFFEELDFDDEPPARERRGPRLGRRDDGGGGGGGGGQGGGDFYDDEPPRGRRSVEYRRIAILVAAVVLVAVVGYFWVQRCQRSQEVDSYRSYVRDANAQTVRANKAAAALQAALLKQGQTAEGLTAAFTAAAKEQQAVVTALAGLHGPGKLGALQADLLQAQQLRAAGLAGMAKTLPPAFAAFDPKAAAIPADKVGAVSLLYHRVLAGDIVYHDAFQVPATAALREKRISAIEIEPSQFVTAPLLSFVLPSSLAERLSTIIAGAQPTGAKCKTPPCKLHGTSIAGVSVDGKALSQAALTVVSTSPTGVNTIEVKVKNSGDFQETQVTVSVFQTGEAQGKPQSILILDPGQTASLNFPFKPVYGTKQTIKVVVDGVPSEKNLQNNIATYNVTFQLSG